MVESIPFIRMSADKEPLVTGEMVGLFVVFGADLIVVVVLLAVVGVIDALVAGVVTVTILAVFGGWVGLRWWRLQSTATAPDEADPLETLKERYAAGDLSDAEFETKLDALLDSDRERDTVEEQLGTQIDITQTEETDRSR